MPLLSPPKIKVHFQPMAKMMQKTLQLISDQMLIDSRPILIVAKATQTAMIKDQLRKDLKIKKHQVQLIRDQDEYLSDKLDDARILIVTDSTLVNGNIDLKIPVIPLVINFNLPNDIQTLIARISRAKRGGGVQ
jgi:hypothetical protein